MKKTRGGALALLLTPALFATSAHATTLWEVYQKALENDPTYLGSIASKEQQQQDVEIAATAFWPNLKLNASYNRTENSTLGADSTNKTSSYGATLSMSLYDKYKNVASSRAKTVFLKSEFDFKASQQDLIYRVAREYFAVLTASDNVQFSKAEQNAISRQLEQTKQRFEVGLVAITDVHEAQARFDLSLAQGIKFENDLGVAVEALQEITGTALQDIYGLSAEAPMLRPNPEDIDHWLQTALKENPRLNSSQLAIDLAAHDKDSIRANNYPTLGLNVVYTHSNQDSDSSVINPLTNLPYGVTTTDTNNTSGTIYLSYNFWDAGTTREKVKQSVSTIEITKQNNEKTRREIQRQTRSAYLDVIAGVSRIAALRQAVVSRESAQKAAEAGFEVGTKTTVDVLDSRRELFSAQNEYAKARYDFILNSLNLKVAAGTLNEKDLKQVDDWLVAEPIKEKKSSKKK